MQLLLALLALPLSTLARPNPVAAETRTDCGNVRNFYDPTPEKWAAANTDEWLNNWWTTNQESVDKYGFAAAFTRATLDVEGLTCKLSGVDSNCVSDTTCNNRKFSSLSPADMEPAYYVLSALRLFHGYINGYQETIESAAVIQSFEQDIFTQYFYLDPNVIDPTALKELINFLVTILSIGAAGIGIAVKAGVVVSGVIASGATMANGAQTEAALRFTTQAPDMFGATANSGHAVAKAIKETFISLFDLNDKLMGGQEIKQEGGYNAGDLRQFLKGGRWVNAPELSKVHGLDVMTGVLQSIQINALWRQQSVFIMGGLSCHELTELGATPRGQQGYVGWCDEKNDQAWYLYFFQSKAERSWLSRPWGSDRLGKDSLLEALYGDASEFPNVAVTDAIRSSVTSWKVAENSYDSAKFAQRMRDIMADGNDILSELSSLEGLWTIPVCDVSGNIGSNTPYKNQILMPYGYNSFPEWCGNICSNSEEKTNDFYKKANLEDTKLFNYRTKCDSDKYYPNEH